MAAFFITGALAQPVPEQPSRTLLERFSTWLNDLGKMTESFISPHFGSPNGDESPWSGLKISARELSQNYPLKSGVPISITHEFGEVRVVAWDSPLVRVDADIEVGAESVETAQVLAESIVVSINPSDTVFDVKTAYPSAQGQGKVEMRVNIVLTVPRDAPVMVENKLGDTLVEGISGNVGINSRLGAVDLRSIAGEVNVRASGEFPMLALNLAKGGNFDLQWSHAEFINVAGPVDVSNFQGTVTIRDLALDSDMTVRNDFGPVHLYVPENARPDLIANVFSGSLVSDMPLDQTQRGLFVGGRSMNVESSQHIDLTSMFDAIHIHREGMKSTEKPQGEPAGDFIMDSDSPVESVTLPEGSTLSVQAIRGDIRVEGVDSDTVEIKVARVIRMTRKDNARQAVEALSLTHGPRANEYIVQTEVIGDMESLGCTYYRVDLEIRCPRNVPLKVVAENGSTVVRTINAPLTLIQTKGGVSVEECAPAAEPFTVTAIEGDVTLVDCAGPLAASAKKGTLTTRNVQGAQRLECTDGRTIVDTPRGPLSVVQQGGEVRILPLEGIAGDYDVSVTKGDLNLLVTSTSNVVVFAKATNGEISSSSVQLNGTNFQNVRDFTGQLNDGTHRVTLTVTDGSIAID
ncbi:MAG: hypothetical protein AMXMBFR84_23120 [Candidatus Hydrogenedentota bacterium]